MNAQDIQALNHWFQEEKRDFPWRKSPGPYEVWVSEIMLQQTQANVVVGYFERWMVEFPNIEALASAPLEKVIKVWEGLGYYSRARHMHEAAKMMVHKYQGQLPSNREELEQIKGLGPYTVGAILSFAFHQKSAAVDGNVIRVLSRFFLIEEDVASMSVRQKIHQMVQDFLPDENPWITMEALIELGAQICRPMPQCSRCPLQPSCSGFRNGRARVLPVKKNRMKIKKITRAVAIVVNKNAVLLRRGTKGKVMADLYEFPYVEAKSNKNLERFLKARIGIEWTSIKTLPKVSHSFTRYKAELYPFLCSIPERSSMAGYEWVDIDKIAELPFSAGHRRILTLINL
ncbi:MAG TPA: A/G-specific adenine glycosylase [Rhabdochlamydiaceae bacterium]|nr:A/G-specific adenine glycosylase [Rhabdochlamydiaceae bacterium]